MASDKQIAANRRNSLQSTGPTSVPGKAAASMNALKTGIHAKSVIIPTEKASDLQQLTDEYYAAYQPATPVARGLIDDLIRCEWTLRRLDSSEASLWNYQNDQSIRPVPNEHRQGKILGSNAKTLAAIQRRIDSTRRGRDRALEALRKLASQPLTAPKPQPEAIPDPVTPSSETTSQPIGFVPSLSPQAPAPTVELSPDSHPTPFHTAEIARSNPQAHTEPETINPSDLTVSKY
ncbi:MAG: hypothetical protein ABI806_05365 [Candidatus Solibacter sp.]